MISVVGRCSLMSYAATALEDSTIIGTTIELASVRPTDLTIVILVAVEILEINAGLLAGDTRIGANYCF